MTRVKVLNLKAFFAFATFFATSALLSLSSCSRQRQKTFQLPPQITQAVAGMESDPSYNSSRPLYLSASQAQAQSGLLALSSEEILKELKSDWGELDTSDIDSSFIPRVLSIATRNHFNSQLNKSWPSYSGYFSVLRNSTPALEAVTGKFLKENPQGGYLVTPPRNEVTLAASDVAALPDDAVILVDRSELLAITQKTKSVAAFLLQEKAVADILKEIDPDASNLPKIMLIAEAKIKKPPAPYSSVLLVQGVLTGFDPHSRLLSSESSARIFESKHKSVGVGISVRSGKAETYVITSTIKNGPAAAAGIFPGDQITAVDGKSTKDFAGVSEVCEAIVGDAGTVVKIQVRRGIDSLDIDVTRAPFEVPIASVSDDINIPDAAFVTLKSFGSDMVKNLKDSVASHRADGKKYWVVDLRGNPGGLVNEAVSIVRYLSSGLKDLSQILAYYSSDGSLFRDDKIIGNSQEKIAPNLIVLINEHSASASEITSGNLKALGSALILGSRSYGKGSAQGVIELSNKMSLGITRGIYFTGGNRTPQFVGVEPHFNTTALRQRHAHVSPEDVLTEADEAGAITPPAARGAATPYPVVYPKTLQCLKDLEASNKLVTEEDFEGFLGAQLGVEGLAAAKAIECMAGTGEAK